MAPRCRIGPASRSRRGFTLIEVLIALLVFAFGLLGCAVLQLGTLQATHSSYQRTVASIFAIDIGERLWVNLANGQIQTDWLADWQDQRSCGTDDGHVCLPDLQVAVGRDGDRHRITVSWAETRFDDATDSRTEFDYVLTLPPETLP
ncbi:type IV pilus modification protein PilV [Thioalkalivibrio nitratireducens DSM 14787]|uniref:Type IV pilus modification protein PilV n=1 Tax=Thioalkalivibrio nitratireducens (strain DSM 14787 / UNIQEM 213 / ALEN2) TaxID=1255043 RepID=L0DSV5_THIND|nr:type IV pilus modification protein PilV [Thioalkalivibrio nitratireducens DSM 14787]